jgi:hypothetical protein
LGRRPGPSVEEGLSDSNTVAVAGSASVEIPVKCCGWTNQMNKFSVGSYQKKEFGE